MTDTRRGVSGWLCVVSVLVTACGGPAVGRIGAVTPLPSGPAKSACETRGWYELAPTRVRAQAQTAGVGVNTLYLKDYEGYGIYRAGAQAPEELEDVWTELKEPELQRAHEARIEPVDAAYRRSIYWSVGGLVGMGVGIGVAAGVQDENKTAAAIAGISGAVVGIVGLVGALIAQPSGYDALEADARRTLLVPREDDLDAAARGTSRANEATRLRCSAPHP